MRNAAFKGTYADWRLVKTRGVIQVIIEVPLSEADDAYQILGGMPDSAKERWFGIAAISIDARPEPKQDKPARAKRDWRDVPPAEQSGMRCDEAAFTHFLREVRPDDWHETQDTADCVRLICGVESRTELGTNHRARMIWKALDDQYEAWKLRERVS